jgi:hypothetical protein
MYISQKERLLEYLKNQWEDQQKINKYWTVNRIRFYQGITTPKRNYKSVDWIQNIVDGLKVEVSNVIKVTGTKRTSKSVEARIRKNLLKKQNLLNIMRCMITDAMIHHESRAFCWDHRMHKITMRAKNYNVWEEKERMPVIVKVNVPSIADRLQVSEVLIWKYLKAMERAKFIQTPDNLKRHSHTMGAYRIIGGYVIHRERPREKGHEGELPPIVQPVYFWAPSRPDIKERLASFRL